MEPDKYKPDRYKLNPLARPFFPISMRKDQPEEVENKQKEPQELDDEVNMEIDMDVEYLLATFSDMSPQCIFQVYMANNGDLDLTMDMLHELIIFDAECEKMDQIAKEPKETGDVPEKDVKDEANAPTAPAPSAPTPSGDSAPAPAPATAATS